MDSGKLLEVALPALIAAIVAGIGGVMAYRRWRRERNETVGAKFRSTRIESYEELWRRVEGIHTHLRRAEGPQATARDELQAVNAYLLEKSLYVDAEDREIAQDYIASLQTVGQYIWTDGSAKAREAWVLTQPLPQAEVKAALELQQAWQRAEQLREKLIQRVRAVMGAKSVLSAEDG